MCRKKIVSVKENPSIEGPYEPILELRNSARGMFRVVALVKAGRKLRRYFLGHDGFWHSSMGCLNDLHVFFATDAEATTALSSAAKTIKRI